jgi:hypothetical protein
VRRDCPSQTELVQRSFAHLKHLRMRGSRPVGPVLVTDHWAIANGRRYQGFYTVVTKCDDATPADVNALCGLDVNIWQYADSFEGMQPIALAIVRANPRSLMLGAGRRNGQPLVQWLIEPPQSRKAVA